MRRDWVIRNSTAIPFNAAVYWEERLRKNPGITGVGYTSLGRGYNEWLYKIRRRVFLRLTRSLKDNWGAESVLDVGSGTGFYVQLWKEIVVKSLVGSDLTETSILTLRKRFPFDNFHQFDIGGSPPQLWTEYFGIVSAFDVLFHIVDDSRYKRAIENVHSMLGEGGLFIFSDIFRHGPTQRSIHMVSRSLNEVESLLRDTGFEIVRRVPMFVIMNKPLDTNSRTHLFLWRLFEFITRRSEFLGRIFGAALYPFELILTRICRESPTTEILVCRKVSV